MNRGDFHNDRSNLTPIGAFDADGGRKIPGRASPTSWKTQETI